MPHLRAGSFGTLLELPVRRGAIITYCTLNRELNRPIRINYAGLCEKGLR
jgi:hypothetical protein